MTTMMESPLKFSLLQDNPFTSPAKRFALQTTVGEGLHTNRQELYVDIDIAANDLQRGSLSKSNQDLWELLQDIPKKAISSCMNNYNLYPPVLKLYEALSNGSSPAACVQQAFPGVHLSDQTTKRKVYQMAFDVMHNRAVIEELLIESNFYSKYFDLQSHELLLIIMAYDFQAEKFNLKLPDDEVDNVAEPIATIAQALWQHRVKLNATLARMRVKGDAQSIAQLIPDERTRLRYQRDAAQPCYARVNSIKVSNVQVEVLDELIREGFTVTDSQEQLCKCEMTVHQAEKDLLGFSPDCRNALDTHKLVKDSSIILQDKNSYDFVDSIEDYLDMCSGDVLLTNCNSGIEGIHIATLLGMRGNLIILETNQANIKHLNNKISTFGLDNVQVMNASIESISADAELFKNVKLVVCLPCSPLCISSLGHAVDFILQEGDQYLTAVLNTPSNPKFMKQTSTEAKTNSIDFAFTFHQAEYIVFGTREVDNENGVLVKKSLERHNSESGNRAYNLICSTADTDSDECSDQGYYTAVLKRTEMKAGPPPQDIIARAIAQGILAGDGITENKQIKKSSHKKKANQRVHQDGIPTMTIAAQQKVVKKKTQKTKPNKPFR